MLSLSSYAQESFSKATVLGGYLNLSTRSTNTTESIQFSPVSPEGALLHEQNVKLNSFAISPYIGREVSPYFIFGLRLNYQWLKTKSENPLFDPINIDLEPATVTTNQHQIGGGVFTRFIFFPFSTVHFFIQPAVNYAQTTINPSVSWGHQIKGQLITASISPGVGYNINQRWRIIGLLTGLRYSYIDQRVSVTAQQSQISQLDVLVNLSGLQVGAELRF